MKEVKGLLDEAGKPFALFGWCNAGIEPRREISPQPDL